MNIRKITALIACDLRGVIGKNGTLPWDYPEELERFRRTTDEQIMVMGRKTFETIPEATAKDRFNIIFQNTMNNSFGWGEGPFTYPIFLTF